MMSYLIVVVDQLGKWRMATAADLVGIGVPVRVAEKWRKVRREMSPAGLKRKAEATKN